MVSKVSSSSPCALLNLEPWRGKWTRLPSAWAVPSWPEMLVLLTLHPKPVLALGGHLIHEPDFPSYFHTDDRTASLHD